MVPWILSHRGISENSSTDSTIPAFVTQLEHGFGLEFDLAISSDRVPFVWHERKLVTAAGNVEDFQNLSSDFLSSRFPTIPELSSVGRLLADSRSKRNALHIKGDIQRPTMREAVLNALGLLVDMKVDFFVFDVRPDFAGYIRDVLPGLEIFLSVAHPFDIARYNSAAHETLFSVQDFLKFRNYYDGVWLDEWDLLSEFDNPKKFYTFEVFDLLRSYNARIGLVTPELHATSPGLVGGESHSDGIDPTRLSVRIREIVELAPDVICTDHPHQVRAVVEEGPLES